MNQNFVRSRYDNISEQRRNVYFDSNHTQSFNVGITMIIKEKESIEPCIATLSSFLELPAVSEPTKKKIKYEIAKMRRGFKGEKECAFFLNGFIKDNPNRVVIHDLRIEDNGDVAQIDHLLLNRSLDMFVLESKNYSHGFKILDNGEFEYWNGKAYCGMASPVEQAKRQMGILQRYLTTHPIFPTRMGLPLSPQLDFFVLCAPQSRIVRPKKETPVSKKVVKADLFKNMYKKTMDKASFLSCLKGAANTVSKDTLIEIAHNIVEGHTPLVKNYQAQFGITDEQIWGTPQVKEEPAEFKKTSPRPEEPPTCPRCGSPMVLRKASKGKNAGNSFWGCSTYPKCRGIINIDPDEAAS